jgi:poly-gamma-glutamate capsule biosynthesis protein CapA/YwtB (metallophosphatase superfamily)
MIFISRMLATTGWSRVRMTPLLLVPLLLCLPARIVPAQQTPGASQIQGGKADITYEAQSGDITIALTGDSLITRPLKPFREKEFLRLRDLLLGADVRFGNAETLFHNYEDWPNPNGVGVMIRADPDIIKDLQWLGINMMSFANNHSNDFGDNGVLTNIHYLDQAGMVHAGTGRDYAEAVAPTYLETPKGRVGFIAATTSGQVGSRAGEQLRDFKGTPGVNLIRWITEWTVDKEAFDQLKRVAQHFNWEQGGDSLLARFYAPSDKGEPAPGDSVNFHDRNAQGMPTSTKTNRFIADPPARFVLGTSFERNTRMNEEDLKRNVQSVSDAHRMADWVVYSVHNHEGGDSDDLPSDHAQDLAHAVIDAGADVFVGTGPHHPRGIEIYKGRPIFYSLGNFIMELYTAQLVSNEAKAFHGLGNENVPADFYDAEEAKGISAIPDAYEGAIPIVSFKGKKLAKIEIYPIEMGFGLPRSQAGRPVLAHGEKAHEILERIQRVSLPFHTKIDIRGDIGVVQVP